jgi:histidinol dehydrogenase
MKIVRRIIKEVKEKGDKAILKYNIKFDENHT